MSKTIAQLKQEPGAGIVLMHNGLIRRRSSKKGCAAMGRLEVEPDHLKSKATAKTGFAP